MVIVGVSATFDSALGRPGLLGFISTWAPRTPAGPPLLEAISEMACPGGLPPPALLPALPLALAPALELPFPPALELPLPPALPFEPALPSDFPLPPALLLELPLPLEPPLPFPLPPGPAVAIGAATAIAAAEITAPSTFQFMVTAPLKMQRQPLDAAGQY